MFTSSSVERDLKRLGTKERAKASAWFFKTGLGQYGYGDVFVGVAVPDQRHIAVRYRELPLSEIEKLLKNKIHECRLTALIILVRKYEDGDKLERREIVKFYRAHTECINNWDLVDSSARYIIGEYLSDKKDRKILYTLARSKNIWERRIAVVATHAFIMRGDLVDAYKISEILLGDKHDLIHKAVGWTLREVGKRSPDSLRSFIKTHIPIMPRTALRYAIECFSVSERKEILAYKY